MTAHAPTMAIVTPTYRPDLDSFRRLHESVLRHTDDSVVHHAAVPGTDVDAFRSIDSPRLRVWSYRDVAPPGIVPTDRLGAITRRLPVISSRVNCAGVSRRRPWQPIRGWVMQQLVKLNMAAHVRADALVFVDSDVVLVRRTDVDDYLKDGAVRFFSRTDGITRSMTRHHRWCQAAHRLLGLPWKDHDTYPDHVAGIVSYDPELVRAGLERVEEVLGYSSEEPRCHSHWSPEPMDEDEAEDFVATFGPEHRAVHIQSTSDTDDRLIDSIVARVEQEVRP
jgi:hypothetical protein